MKLQLTAVFSTENLQRPNVRTFIFKEFVQVDRAQKVLYTKAGCIRKYHVLIDSNNTHPFVQLYHSIGFLEILCDLQSYLFMNQPSRSMYRARTSNCRIFDFILKLA